VHKAAFLAPPSEHQWPRDAGRRRVRLKEGVRRRGVAEIWMVGRWDAPAPVHSAGRRTKVARRDDLGQGRKVHRDATGIFGPWADRLQIAERQGQPRDSLRLGAENKVRRVGLVAPAAAQEMVWELQLERRDGLLWELMEARPLA
jgi:hypothetical protein